MAMTIDLATIDLTQIILAAITLIGAIIARYLIPWIKGKLNDQQSEMLNGMIRVAVFAAEQIFNSSEGKAKKEYVKNLLAENGWNVDLALVDAAIEATVKELRIEMGGTAEK